MFDGITIDQKDGQPLTIRRTNDSIVVIYGKDEDSPNWVEFDADKAWKVIAALKILTEDSEGI